MASDIRLMTFSVIHYNKYQAATDINIKNLDKEVAIHLISCIVGSSPYFHIPSILPSKVSTVSWIGRGSNKNLESGTSEIWEKFRE